jgi:hypothetical protein
MSARVPLAPLRLRVGRRVAGRQVPVGHGFVVPSGRATASIIPRV